MAEVSSQMAIIFLLVGIFVLAMMSVSINTLRVCQQKPGSTVSQSTYQFAQVGNSLVLACSVFIIIYFGFKTYKTMSGKSA